MRLTVSRPRALHRIEAQLRSSDPRLCGLFTLFSRLADGEEMPRTERLRPAWRLLTPLLAALAAVAAGTAATAAARRAVSAMATLSRRVFQAASRAQGPVPLWRGPA